MHLSLYKLFYSVYSNSVFNISQAMSEFERLMEKLDSKLEEFKKEFKEGQARTRSRLQQQGKHGRSHVIPSERSHMKNKVN